MNMLHLERMKPRIKGFDSVQMKYLMAVLMIFDHLFIIPGLLSDNTVAWLHLLTRMVAPWFAFAAVEAFIYSSNRLRYLFRLLVASLVMIYGSRLLNLWLFSESNQVSNNIFLSLAMGTLCLLLLYPDKERLKRELSEVLPSFDLNKIDRVPNWLLSLLVIPLVVLVSPQIEGQYLVPLMMVLLYMTRKSHLQKSIAMLVLSLFYLVMSWINMGSAFLSWPLLGFSSQWFMFSVIPFFFIYNGKPGKHHWFNRYFLYVFYISHLWILHLIAEFVLRSQS